MARAAHRRVRHHKHPVPMTEALWPLFLVASVVVIATPGQDMILVMSKSLAHGTRAGVATAAGVSVGLVGHTLLATLGLGAVLRTSEWLFTALKFLGAAYLLYLGARLLLTRAAALNAATPQPQSTARLFVTGGLSNISNPKIAVFYFAFLPQFVSPRALHPTLTIFVLGIVFAGRLSSWFQSRPKALVWLYRFNGVVMVGLAVRLALSRRSDA